MTRQRVGADVATGLATTVRDSCWKVFRSLGLTRFFANPGSTEVPLLVNFPEDFEFVLALHEASVVGLATGWALARDAPALVLLHTTAGLGNAVGALATAREMGVPLVVLVGQQDRRHLASEPFLTGRLSGLAGDYPTWVGTPPRAVDLPDYIARAYNEAAVGAGPAIVIVPMDDWLAEPAPAHRPTTPTTVQLAAEPAPEAVTSIVRELTEAERPVIVSGSGAASDRAWAALESIAAKLDAPVWQEPFGARPGFRQNSPAFRGLLSAGRSELRAQLAGHDLVLVVGAQAVRQYGYEPGPFFDGDVRVIVLAQHTGKAVVSTADLALVVDVAAAVEAIDRALPGAPGEKASVIVPVPAASPALTPQQIFAALGSRLEADTAVFEESPSNRDDMSRYLPARSPWGFVSAAMGGLGFALPAAIGMRMAAPDRPVVGVIGDGSSMYAIHALWSAAQYGAGALIVILANGGYAIMDRLAAAAGGAAPWPGLADISIETIARGFGVEARRVSELGQLEAVLDDVVPGLRGRQTPLVVVAEVVAEPERR